MGLHRARARGLALRHPAPRSSSPVPAPLPPPQYGVELETPFGVAAGPHSQMAQNIVAAWLCGARFIELKTVQTLDELEVSKPCIDMKDEGYNVEWSQELKVHQSFDEYVRAWVLIHALHRRLGFPGETPGRDLQHERRLQHRGHAQAQHAVVPRRDGGRVGLVAGLHRHRGAVRAGGP